MVHEVRCPGCGALVPLAEERRPRTFPFCSARCRVVDLGAWADGTYVVAGRAPAFADPYADDQWGARGAEPPVEPTGRPAEPTMDRRSRRGRAAGGAVR